LGQQNNGLQNIYTTVSPATKQVQPICFYGRFFFVWLPGGPN